MSKIFRAIYFLNVSIYFAYAITAMVISGMEKVVTPFCGYFSNSDYASLIVMANGVMGVIFLVIYVASFVIDMDQIATTLSTISLCASVVSIISVVLGVLKIPNPLLDNCLAHYNVFAAWSLFLFYTVILCAIGMMFKKDHKPEAQPFANI